ncbi:ROK family protein [Planctomonas deserti]|uniref:ROK family protein n=1 Tax=Planctomonas deserti TaxID=2144185 RepID=UPI00131EFABD|nr:ROK family protein [Planctomonas deserti]
MIVGIETGGTKVICGAAREGRPQELVRDLRIPTTTPDETTDAINAFLDEIREIEPVTALGVASFGPINVEPDKPRWGWVTGTPKPGWADTDLLGRIRMTAEVPTVLLSDVASAALGEQTWGAGAGVPRVAYATFGTGVGVGLCLDGRVLHGNGYPEMGHLLVRRHPRDDYEGSCPFHGDCLEGLASGPAVLGRWGSDASSLDAGIRAQALDILAFYIAQLAAATAYTTGVERFVVGGGVLKTPGLFDAVVERLPGVTGGPGASHAASLDEPGFLASPALGDHSGVLGAIAAARALLPR